MPIPKLKTMSGKLGNDPLWRKDSRGEMIAVVSIAQNIITNKPSRFQKARQTKHGLPSVVHWYDVVISGPSATSPDLKKGAAVQVTGVLRTRYVQDKFTKSRRVKMTTIMARDVALVRRRDPPASEAQQATGGQAQQETGAQAQQETGGQAQQGAP